MIRGSGRFMLGSLVGGLLLGAILGAIFWLVSPETAPGPSQRVLVPIPAGTAARIAAGTAATAVDLPPATLGLSERDTLVVRNDDSVTHRVGSWWISPGAVLELPVAAITASTNVFSCTFHPGGTLELRVAKPDGPASVIVPALLVGLPTGTVIGLVGSVVRRLDDEPEIISA